MFFLSLILTGICGYLHGFGSELCIFMAFYTAIEGTLLTNGKRQHALLDMVTRILYLLLFPAMLIVFVCFELGFTEYGIVVPVLTIAGVVILVLGAYRTLCMTHTAWTVRTTKRRTAISGI